MKMTLRVLATLLLMVLRVGALGATSEPGLAVSKPLEVQQGGIAVVEIFGEGLTIREARMGTERVHFFHDGNGSHRAVIAADVEAPPGLTALSVHAVTAGGVVREVEIAVRITKKNFREESFTVAPRFDQYTPELLDRIGREREIFARAFAVSAPQRWWDKPFVAPVPLQVTSPFGYRRIINGTPRSPHSGTDLKASTGTAVAVANHGRVVLTGDFYFAGKSIVVDHGANLFTMYFHLSEILVDQGADVRRGAIIALSGMTGRVTGPHLHWAARVGEARVDPLELLEKLGDSRALENPGGSVTGEK